jgi:hypothetical protein
VLADVGQRLLDDPVGGAIRGWRERDGAALDPAVDGEAGSAQHCEELVEGVQPGRGDLGRGRRVTWLAQQADGVPQLLQGLAARRLHVAEGLAGRRGIAVDRPARDVGLHADQCEVVAHAIVQVAGDAQALLGDPPPRVLLALKLGPLGAPLDLGEVGAAVAR